MIAAFRKDGGEHGPVGLFLSFLCARVVTSFFFVWSDVHKNEYEKESHMPTICTNSAGNLCTRPSKATPGTYK
ncbi:hypothetical protein IF1G_10907 [Cordyceps javanica]|uniref:Uncharacterized protein n=1 Tax=Cordyceps javanica TaxID=43265 RepID=A0A545ULT4_9HYPO|nr:hypothetical protein IF1G_10907 [Cordyceps javanica]